MGGMSASRQWKVLTLQDYQGRSTLKHWLTCTLCNDVKAAPAEGQVSKHGAGGTHGTTSQRCTVEPNGRASCALVLPTDSQACALL